MAGPSVVITSATFSDGTTVSFSSNDIIVFVGPNNAGKSVALRNIKEMSTRKDISGLVVKDVTLNAAGTDSELETWLEEHFRKNTNNPVKPSVPRS